MTSQHEVFPATLHESCTRADTCALMCLLIFAIRPRCWTYHCSSSHAIDLSRTLNPKPLIQGKKKANRIFYLSIPPSIFTDVAAAASDAASSPTGWNRVIVEKPFGRDLESYQV